MTYEAKERRRRKLQRDAIARDLHSRKYRQRKLPKKRRGGRNDRQTIQDIQDILDVSLDNFYDDSYRD